MFDKTKFARDAFTFSLGGITTVSAFTAAPAIAWDRLHKVPVEGLDENLEDQPSTEEEMTSFFGRYWLRALRRAA